MRQIEVGAAAEADEPELVARANRFAFVDIAKDTPRDQARDLRHRNVPPVGQSDRERVALVVLGRLVQTRAQERAVPVGDAGHGPVGRDPVRVDVQHR